VSGLAVEMLVGEGGQMDDKVLIPKNAICNCEFSKTTPTAIDLLECSG
jgi:hypothetical protein